MESVAEFKVVACASLAMCHYAPVVLHHVVISQLCNGQQALKTCVHVAVERVIFQSDNSIFVGGQPLVLSIHRFRLTVLLAWISFAPTVAPWILLMRLLFLFYWRVWNSNGRDVELYAWILLVLNYGRAASVKPDKEVKQVLGDAVKTSLWLGFVSWLHRYHVLKDLLVVHGTRMHGVFFVFILNELEPSSHPVGADHVVSFPCFSFTL